jgi:membrane dipeptidase
MKKNSQSNKPVRIDCHCDTILEIATGTRSLGERSSRGHIDIPRLREGQISLQFFALYIESQFKPIGALERTLELIDTFYRELAENTSQLKLIKTFSDIEAAQEENKIGAFLTVEGGEAIQESLFLLRNLYRLGIRGITLTWNQRNAIADGASEGPHGGLSRFGLKVIEEMNSLGMLIDVSHMNRGGFFDVLNNSKMPVIASHSNARALCNHPRNLDDEQIVLLAEKKGIICVTFVPEFLVPVGSQADINSVADHIDYIKHLVGVDYIGIGSDFDGTEEVPAGLEDVTKVPHLEEVLRQRGYTEAELEKIFGGNVLRLLKRVIK